MRVVFSSLFKQDLLEAEARYSTISARLGDEFHGRVKEAIGAVIQWKGGDHIGPHGYPCRRCRPFPYLVYYAIEDEVLYILGIVHTRKYPDYLRKNLEENG